MGTGRPAAGLHLLGLARRHGSGRSCHSARVSPVSAPRGTDADCGPFVTLRPFAPPGFHPASSLLWPLLTPGSLSRARSPRVRTCTLDPCRQTLPNASFGDSWISRSLARSSPAPGLAACSCSYGRVFDPPFLQLGLAASTLGFTTLLVTLRGYLLSGNKYMPMSGTLGAAPSPRSTVEITTTSRIARGARLLQPLPLVASVAQSPTWSRSPQEEDNQEDGRSSEQARYRRHGRIGDRPG
jgi:hypothetical protein